MIRKLPHMALRKLDFAYLYRKKNPHFDKLGSRVNFSSTCFFSLVTKLTKMAACLQTLFFGFFRLSSVFRHCRKLQNVRQR